MAERLCFSTVSTENHFQYFIPTFAYSCMKANPDGGVRVFLKGKLKDPIQEALKMVPGDCKVIENYFTEYKMRPSTCNSLRFLVDAGEYEGFDYVFVRDVDFVVFGHEPTHMEYFSKRMKSSSYYGIRGPYSHPRRPAISRIGWRQDFTRIAGGTLFFKNPQWLDMTKDQRARYRKLLLKGKHDEFDEHTPASYREYDEVMLYRICKGAGLRTPKIKNKDLYGHHISNVYRDVHLGDFAKKWSDARMKRVLAQENVKKYTGLEEDPAWQEIVKIVSSNDKVEKVLRRARKYMARNL